MASQWLTADDRSQENVQKSKYEDLFVFGYGCKLFRDDEQAKLVDSGKYLIPWMGDERLMIDRSVCLLNQARILSISKGFVYAVVDYFNHCLVHTGM